MRLRAEAIELLLQGIRVNPGAKTALVSTTKTRGRRILKESVTSIRGAKMLTKDTASFPNGATVQLILTEEMAA